MTDPLERVLQLVSEGKLSADDAAPILAALDRKSRPDPGAGTGPAPDMETGQAPAQTPRFARVEVRERGRRVVDLRVPISLGRFALSRVPGLSTQQIAEVEEAVTSGARGPILDVEDEDGDGVRIVLE
jgi:SHOCT-like protein